MAIIIPMEVKTEKELVRALLLERTVIFVKKGELYDKVKKTKKKYSAHRKLGKAGIITSILSVPVGIVCPVSWIIPVAGVAATSLVGGGMLSASGWADKLKKYELSIDEIKKMLILTKVDGDFSIGKDDKIENYSYATGKNNSYVKAVSVDTEDDLIYQLNTKAPCIIVEPNFYKKMRIEPKRGIKYYTKKCFVTIIDDLENMRYIILRNTSFNMNNTRVEGIDLDRMLLDKTVYDRRLYENASL